MPVENWLNGRHYHKKKDGKKYRKCINEWIAAALRSALNTIFFRSKRSHGNSGECLGPRTRVENRRFMEVCDNGGPLNSFIKCGTHEIAVVLIQPGDVVDDVLVAELFVRLFPGERQYFPQRNGKRPHVAPRRVLVLRQHTTTHVWSDDTQMGHAAWFRAGGLPGETRRAASFFF